MRRRCSGGGKIKLVWIKNSVRLVIVSLGTDAIKQLPSCAKIEAKIKIVGGLRLR